MQGYYNFFLGTVLEASVHEAFFNQSIAWEAQTQRYSRNLLILSLLMNASIFIATIKPGADPQRAHVGS